MNKLKNYPSLKKVMKKQIFFFVSGFSFTDTDYSQYCRKSEEISLPLPVAHKYSDIYLKFCKYSDIYLKFCIWDGIILCF